MSEIEYVTLTVNESLAMFPAASIAVHVTVVLPTLKNVPDSGLHVGPEVIPTLSVAVGFAKYTRFPVGSVDASKTSSDTTMSGDMVSTVGVVSVDVVLVPGVVDVALVPGVGANDVSEVTV